MAYAKSIWFALGLLLAQPVAKSECVFLRGGTSSLGGGGFIRKALLLGNRKFDNLPDSVKYPTVQLRRDFVKF